MIKSLEGLNQHFPLYPPFLLLLHGHTLDYLRDRIFTPPLLKVGMCGDVLIYLSNPTPALRLLTYTFALYTGCRICFPILSR